MEGSATEIPTWPAEVNNCPRQMTFLFGEARWYLWMQEASKQAILSLQRDLLLLHQNGDLELCRDRNAPSAGTYVTALHKGRMIRGRVYNPESRSDKSGIIHVIDIDEGRRLQVPYNQVRLLPQNMKSLPCQAVRCDIDLNCIELFKWPPQLNEMLHKLLKGALFYVENISNRPGSIPTISAKITVCYPTTGQCIDMQKLLLQYFSPHLDICLLENFKPFPVGMASNLMANNMDFLHQQMLGLSLQGYPPGLPMPTQFGMLPAPSLMLPSSPMLPSPNPMLASPSPMLPSLNPMLASPSPSMLSPNLMASNCFPPSPIDSALGSSIQSFSVTPTPATPPLQPQPRYLSTTDVSFTRGMGSSNSSLSSAAAFESDYSRESSSTVAIDLDVNLLDSTSSTSASSRGGLLPSQLKEQLVPNTESHRSPRKGRKRNSNPHDSSSSLSAEAPAFVMKRKNENIEHTSSSSSLSADAPPFAFLENSKELEPHSSVDLSADAPVFMPKHSPQEPKNANSHEKNVKSKSPFQKEISTFNNREPIGNRIQLLQINRDWEVGQVVPVLMARVWNPSCFEVNVVDEHGAALPRMQEEMNAYYESCRVAISSKQQAQDLCGEFCACYDPDDKIWFRAQVLEWYPDDSVTPVRVWAVDYGGYLRQDLGCIQPLSSEFCSEPILVTLCSMQNIKPRSQSDIWPEIHLNRVKELLPEDEQLYIRIDGRKSDMDIWPVSVFTDRSCSFDSINEILVAEGCASYFECLPAPIGDPPTVSQDFEDFDDPMAEAYNKGQENHEYDDEDACVAVSGYKPTDEVGICWFYQREGYCYKKYCDKKHIRLNDDGTTQEKMEIHINAFEEISDIVIAPGKCIKLAISRILTVHHFIAKLFISSGTEGLQSRETLASVLRNLNSIEMKRSLKTFTEYPADGEIVLAKDKDGIFYRGRIIGSDAEDDSMYEVLNVDSGVLNWVSLQNLRRMDPAFLHHPFQAIECWLADVSPVATDKEWVKTCNAVLADLVKGKKLKATVIRSGLWGLEVNLFDKEGQDIAVILKEMNIVKHCPMKHIPDLNSRILPG